MSELNENPEGEKNMESTGAGEQETRFKPEVSGEQGTTDIRLNHWSRVESNMV